MSDRIAVSVTVSGLSHLFSGDLSAVVEAARVYAQGKRRTRFRSPDELTGPLEAAGLEMLHAAPADAGSRRLDRPTVPLSPRMYRLCVAARRSEAP